MLPTGHLLSFVLTAFVLIAVPGPSVLFVISRSLTLGRNGGLATVLGNALGVYVQVLAVAFGIGAVVERSVAVFTVIKLVGAAYLTYLGVQAIRHRRDLCAALGAPVEAKSTRRILADAFVVGVVSDGAWAIAAGTARTWLGGTPRRLEMIGGAGGVAMISIGARLAISGRSD